MTNLPQNQIYNTHGNTLNFLKPRTIGENISLKGIPFESKQPIDTSNILKSISERPKIPTGVSIAEPEQRFQDIPISYSGFRTERTPQGFEWPSPNLEETKLRAAPGIIEGQYVVDRSQPGKIIKSNRGLSQAEKKIILAGRPSYLYEVDHIIPLWAGGADTTANYQVLSLPEHEKKTKAQSIAYTLLANGKINESQAKFYALSWKDRDLSDIPTPDEFGTISITDAERIKTRWDEQAGKPEKTTWKSFFSAIPESGKQLGAKLDEKTENLPAFLQGAIKGAASGLTAGWIRYNEDLNNKGGWETAGQITGNIGSTLLSIGMISKALGIAYSGLRTARVAKGIESSGIIGKTETLGSKTKEAIASVRVFRKASDPSKRALAQVMTNNFLKYTPAITTYGQIQESFEDTQKRGKRFFEDVVYGGLTGFISPTLKGTLGVAGLAFSTSLIMDDSEGEEALKNSLITAGTMSALHGISAPGVRKQAAKITRDIADEELTRIAHNTFNSYLGNERISFLSPETKVPSADTMSREKIMAMRIEARNKLMQNAFGGDPPAPIKGKGFTMQEPPKNMDIDTLNNELRKLEAAGEYLEMRTLTPEERDIRIIQNIYSVYQKTQSGDILKGTPDYIRNIIHNVPDKLLSNSYAEHINLQSGKYPTGTMKTTGLGARMEINPEGFSYFLKQKAAGKASPTLVAVKRSDTEALFRNFSNDPAIKWKGENVSWIDTNPQNAIQIWGIVWDEAGTKTAVDLGWWPQGQKIEGRKFSFNSQKEISEGKFPKYNLGLNKDIVSDTMNKEGLDFLFLNMDTAPNYSLSLEKGKPFLQFNLNDENWAKSIAENNLFKQKVGFSEKPVPKLISEFNKSLNSKTKQDTISELNRRNLPPSHDLFNTESSSVLKQENPGGTEAIQSILENANEALSQNSPEAMADKFKKFFGVNLNKETAEKIFIRRMDVTNNELFNEILRNADKQTSILINTLVKPFFESTVFRSSWEYGKVFPEMKVMGGLKSGTTSSVKVIPFEALKTEIPVKKAVFSNEEIKFLKKQGFSDEFIIKMEEQEAKKSSFKTEKPQTVFKTSSESLKKPQQTSFPIETPITSKTLKTSEIGASVGPKQGGKSIITTPIQTAAKIVQKAKEYPEIVVKSKKEYISTADAKRSVEFKTPVANINKKEEIKNIMSQSVREMEDKGTRLIEDTVVPRDRAQYIKRLKSILDPLSPIGKVAENGKIRNFTTEEAETVSKLSKNTLLAKAEDLVENVFDLDEEIRNKGINISSDDPVLKAMKSLIKSDTANKLGNRESALGHIESVPEKDLKEASKLLGIYIPSEIGSQKAHVSELTSKEVSKIMSSQYLKEGKNMIESVEEGIKQKKDPYRYAYSKTLDEGLNTLFGEYKKDDNNLKAIGSVFPTFGKRFKQLQKTLFETRAPGGIQEKTHFVDYLIALGKDDPKAIEKAKIRRAKNLLKENIKEENLSLKKSDLSKEEMSAGGLRILSPTQDIGQVKGLSDVWVKLYPGLNAAIEGGKLGPKQGVLDAKKMIEFISGSLKAQGRNVGLKLMPIEERRKFVKGILSEAEKQAYFKENNAKQKEFFDLILEKIRKDLGTVRNNS